jgi:hypothetical protein
MQIFFELGLTGVIATFASHEFSKLQWGNRGAVYGDPAALGRFTSLLTKSTKWFAVAGIILCAILIPAGLIFFSSSQSTVANFHWKLPWVLAVIVTAINLVIIPFFAVIMGSGEVVTVNHREMLGSMIGSCISWVVILLQGGLYSIVAVGLGNVLISGGYLLRQKPLLLKTAWRAIIHSDKSVYDDTISWRREIWPLQWKIGLSWVSGYFIFQLFNPVLFYYHGAVVAGQMGMTLTASNALLALSLNWMNVKAPELGKLIALRDWLNLDKVFNKAFYQSLSVVTLGAVIGSLLIWYFQIYYEIGSRFIPAKYATVLFFTVGATLTINNFAVYLRAHKQEPFFWLSILAAILQGTATLFLGKNYGVSGITASFLLVNLFIIMPLAFFIWRRCKVNWHV